MLKNFFMPLTFARYMFIKVMFCILLFFQALKKKNSRDFSRHWEKKNKKLSFHPGGVYETRNPALIGHMIIIISHITVSDVYKIIGGHGRRPN